MEIHYLKDHQDFIPIIAKWFFDEWADFYPVRSIEWVESRIAERVNTDTIPFTLVAVEDDELIGTVAIKQYDMDTRMDLTPWLAGLYVSESWRKQGVGTSLVRAVEKKAKDMGIAKLYLYTPNEAAFYQKLGWNELESTTYKNKSVMILEKVI